MSSRVDAPGEWRLRLGARVLPRGGVRFAVWAPRAREVSVVISRPAGHDELHPLAAADDGVYVAMVPNARSGDRYRYQLDLSATYPDPWSRSQPDGVHGASEVVDPSAFRWTDDAWRGPDPGHQVIYELHVGTFTPEGTFDGVVSQLPELRRLGITAVELMPVAEFPGRRNWGYDGVDLFAPSRNYGGAAGLKRLVDAAHRLGLSIYLDVVFNHLGPDGNYLAAFSDDYFANRHQTPWGPAINFDGPSSRRVRELFVQNACYWLVEYHIDGLRLDATHAIVDTSPVHVLAELARTARASVAPRRVVIAAEDGRNDVSLVRPFAAGGYGLDAVWSDDFHHAVHTLFLGEREGYYADYDGTASAVARTIESGFLYQGQLSLHRPAPRGTPVGDEPASAFTFFLQNHDQIGNRGFGERLNHLLSGRRVAVATVLFLLCPETPLLFMGQEFAASTPFLYFTDHDPELGRLVTRGRRAEFARFTAFRDPTTRELIPDPQALETFQRSRLDLAERERNAAAYALHRELLRLRRTDPVFSNADRQRASASAPGDGCVILRRWNGDGSPHRLVIANFGPGVRLRTDVNPNLDALASGRWQLVLSSNEERFGGDWVGGGSREAETISTIRVPAITAFVFSLVT